MSASRLSIDEAWRYSAALRAALPRKNCWCGVEGHFRFQRGGAWFCALHVERGADGVLRAVEAK